MLVQQEVAARAALLEGLLARLPIEAARVRDEVQERLEQLASQARSLTEEVGQLNEAAQRGLVAHQLAVLKLHVKLATMPASQQKEEWGRLEGELPASLLTFLPSTEGVGTLRAGQGAPAPPVMVAAAPKQGWQEVQEVQTNVLHQGGQEVLADTLKAMEVQGAVAPPEGMLEQLATSRATLAEAGVEENRRIERTLKELRALLERSAEEKRAELTALAGRAKGLLATLESPAATLATLAETHAEIAALPAVLPFRRGGVSVGEGVIIVTPPWSTGASGSKRKVKADSVKKLKAPKISKPALLEETDTEEEEAAEEPEEAAPAMRKSAGRGAGKATRGQAVKGRGRGKE